MELRYRLLRWFDVAAVICLAVLPDLWRSIFAVTRGVTGAGYTFGYMHGGLLTRSVQVAVPILLIMLLRKVSWQRYGFRAIRPGCDVIAAAGLVLASYASFILAYGIVIQFGPIEESGGARVQTMIGNMSPTTWVAMLVMIGSGLANGFAEELALRSYLISRLVELMGSKLLAVVFTSVLFGAYHIYQGMLGAVGAFAIGIVLGTYFVRKRRFWPVAAAHAAMDIIPQLVYRSSH